MLQGRFLPEISTLEMRFYCESPQTPDQTNKLLCNAIWWFYVEFGYIVLVYIHRCCSHAEQRLEEMLQGRFLPGGLSMQKKATMLQTTIAEIYLNKNLFLLQFL